MFLFAVFFHDLHEALDVSNKYGLRYKNVHVGSSAYADDVVVLSNTHNGLQCMLNNAVAYSRKWRFTFSAPKSKCVIFGETKQQNKVNSQTRVFQMGECQIEEVQHFVHVGVELCSYFSAEHRTKSRCNKAHGIMASLTSIGVRSDALNPIVANSLWNKIWLSSILYGSEVWYGLTKTEALMLDKLQIRKLKQMQSLPLRTHDALVTVMVKQYSVMTIIEIKKMYFLCKLICSTGITKCIFVNRLYDNILSI